MLKLLSYALVTAISLGLAYTVATTASNAVANSLNNSSAMIASTTHQ